MPTRRDFFRHAALGAGALAGLPAFAAPTTPMPDGIPRRFVFIRKSNGLRPHEVALPSLAGADKDAEHKKRAFEVSLDKHELPAWMRPLEPHREHLGILQGLSAKMSENGHYSYLEEGHQTLGNWYTTLLKALGNPIPHYGDLEIEMERKKLKQTGAIQRFIA